MLTEQELDEEDQVQAAKTAGNIGASYEDRNQSKVPNNCHWCRRKSVVAGVLVAVAILCGVIAGVVIAFTRRDSSSNKTASGNQSEDRRATGCGRGLPGRTGPRVGWH